MNSNYAQDQLAKLNPEGYSSLIPLFEESCGENSFNCAYNCLGQAVSYTDIERMSRNFAAFLVNGLGLAKGDRIAIQLPNLIQYPVVAWSALRAGLTIVNTNPIYTKRELLHQLNDSGARALVMWSDSQSTMEKVVPQTDIEFVISTNVFDIMEAQAVIPSEILAPVSLPDALNQGEDLELPAINITMNDLALLQYTGGTTGVAKGSMLTRGDLFASYRQTIEAIPPHPTQQDVMKTGGMSVLIPDPRDINGLVQTMKQFPFSHSAVF